MPTTASPLLTIKAVADLTGVPAATLRAWERRYGIASPRRTEAGYRTYDAVAVDEIRRMQVFLEAGASPRLAAEAVIRERADTRTVARTESGELPVVQSVVAAAQALDEPAIAELLDRALGAASFERCCDLWLFPALRAVGEAWVAGDLDIAGEHLVSAAVMRRLSALYDTVGRAPGGARVLVGLPAGGEHEIPSLAFAIAARRAGLAAVYLGPNLPPSAWLAAARDHGPRAVVISAATPDEGKSAGEVARLLRTELPELLVAVGGAGVTGVEPGVIRLEGGIPDSAASLAKLVRAR